MGCTPKGIKSETESQQLKRQPRLDQLSGFDTNGVWQARFFARTNWLYTLERTTNFSSWAPVSPAVRGVNSNMSLPDTNAVTGKAFYRVRAQ